jgi:putative ABC transport system permease protein
MVGVVAVIAMIGIGSGASVQVTERISEMGANLLMVFPGAFQRGPARGASGGLTSLTYDDAQAIAKQCPSVAKVDASYSRNAQVVYGNQNTNTNVSGVTPYRPEVNNFPVERGSFFTDEDERLMRRVAVLGKTTVENLFGEENPIGKYVKIKRSNYQVIGVMSEKGSSGFRDEDDVIFVPLRTAQKRLFGVDYVSTINASVKSVELSDRASAEITNLLRSRHRIGTGEESDFSVLSQATLLSTVQETTRTFTVLLAGIAAVSLVVGGIGIMNIMFVSVSERTREIGIRKAIGAQRHDILTQFLIEAVIVSLTGGVVGIVFGMLTTVFVGMLGNWPTAISFAAILLSFSFALMVGLFFGFYPARRAALLSPIDALRYE